MGRDCEGEDGGGTGETAHLGNTSRCSTLKLSPSGALEWELQGDVWSRGHGSLWVCFVFNTGEMAGSLYACVSGPVERGPWGLRKMMQQSGVRPQADRAWAQSAAEGSQKSPQMVHPQEQERRQPKRKRNKILVLTY